MSEIRAAGGDIATFEVPLRTMALLALAAFSSSLNIRATDPLLPQIAGSFAVSVGAAASIITSFTVGYGLTQLLFGAVGDRFGKYLVVALTAITAGLATALCSAATSLEVLIAARFFAGAFAGSAIPLAFAWLGDAVPYERRQPVLARFMSAQMMGIVLGQSFGGIVGDLLGWPAAFLIIGAMHTIAGLAMLVELRAHPGDQPPGAVLKHGLGSIAGGVASVVRRPWPRVLLLGVFLEAVALYGALAYVGAYLHHRFGLSFTLVGVLMSAYGVGAILYALSAKQLIARLGQPRLVIGGGLLMALSYVTLAASPVVEVAPCVMVGLGLGFYMMHNVLQTGATQMAPDSRGLGVSLFALALFLGQSVGVALAAPIMDRWGAEPIFLAAAAALPLVALWFRGQLKAAPKL